MLSDNFLREAEYHRMLIEEASCIQMIENTVHSLQFNEAQSISKGRKANNKLGDKRRVEVPKEDFYREKILSGIRNSPQYKTHTAGMSSKDKAAVDAMIEKKMSDYFPSIKEYWINNHCSEKVLIHYGISTIANAVGIVSGRHESLKLENMNFFSGVNEPVFPVRTVMETVGEDAESPTDRFNAMFEAKALLEADQQKINDNYSKFTQILKNMLSKFIDYTNTMVLKNKKYLTDRKDAILAKVNGENVPIEMRNYETGVHNLQSFQIPPFDSISKGLPADPTQCLNAIKQKLMPQYTDLNMDFRQFCVGFFEGGVKKISTNINALNMQNIYNYCAQYAETILPIIQRDFNTMQSLKSSAQKVGNDAAQAARADASAAAQAKGPTSTPPTPQPASPAPAQPATPAPAAAPANGKVNEGTLLEDNQPNPNGQAQQPNNGAKPADSGKMVIGQQQGQVAQNPSTPANNQNTAQTQPSPQGNQPTTATANVELSQLNAYKTIGMQILGAKMTAAATIFSDYIKIMKAHAVEKIEQATHIDPSEVKMPDTAEVMNQVEQIRKELDKNKQAKEINDLIDSVKRNNPNFNGGVNDIAAAAAKQQAAQKNNNPQPSPAKA